MPCNFLYTENIMLYRKDRVPSLRNLSSHGEIHTKQVDREVADRKASPNVIRTLSIQRRCYVREFEGEFYSG